MNATTEAGDVQDVGQRSREELAAGVARFLGEHSGARADHIARLETSGFSLSSFRLAAALFGPLWSASRGLWTPFWIAAAVEAACLTGLVRSWWSGGSPESPEPHAVLLAVSVAVLLAARAIQGGLADWMLWRAWQRWRHGEGTAGRTRPASAALGALAALGLIAISVWRYGVQAAPEYLRMFPAPRIIQRTTAKGIDGAVDWMVLSFEAFFASITVGLREVLNLIEALFIGIPWPVAVVLIVVLAWRAAGWRVGLFSVVALAYLGLFGYWEKSMSTLALVMASALLCIAIGTPIGIWCGKDAKVYAALKPVLDFMQTMPSFVYLIPAVAFFSIGKPPGVIAQGGYLFWLTLLDFKANPLWGGLPARVAVQVLEQGCIGPETGWTFRRLRSVRCGRRRRRGSVL